MKIEDAEKLEAGQKVMHNRYSECSVKEVIISMGKLFGVVITPITDAGRGLLRLDCGCDISDYLEGSVWCLSVDNIKSGSEPLALETIWGTPEEDLPTSEPKDHFAPKDEVLPG